MEFKFKKEGFRKLLIFDLDETLIHCEREELVYACDLKEDPDMVYLNIRNPETNEDVKTGFMIRPYAIECLKVASKYYEIAIFTAGFEWYANPIIDYLDPTSSLI
jgi:TFIIF-interacting CTD phosphatase-like protein